jgi:pimeloyl-ACP methyl ester carboxylesterase
VVAHSRGGLVARRLATAGDPRVRVRRVVFAGTPNGGTAMASPQHINRLLDVYANILTFFPDNGVTDAMQGLLAVVQDVVLGMMDGLRGLTSMVPDNAAEQRVEGPAWNGRYYALASDFSPTQFGLKTLMDPLVSQVFMGAGNDLVVPAESVWRGPEVGPFPLDASAVQLFGAGDGVGHSGYFANPTAITRLLEWLTP